MHKKITKQDYEVYVKNMKGIEEVIKLFAPSVFDEHKTHIDKWEEGETND